MGKNLGGKFLRIRAQKKLFMVCILVIIGSVFSLLINYKNTGVFMGINKKLPIYCVDTKDKKIAISFDVSLGNTEHTKDILDILDKYKIKATFFVVGDWVNKYPDILKQISERGNELGNHSNRHPDMTQLSKDKILEDINVNEAKIRNITGTGTKLFRFPAGSYNDEAVSAVESSGYKCIQWNVDSVDWMEKGSDIEYKKVVENTEPGSILLFHSSAKYTPENLPKIIETLKNKGYNFVTVGNLIYKNNYKINPNGKQIKD